MAVMADLKTIKYVGDASTPTDLQSHVGREVSYDPAVMTDDWLKAQTTLFGVPGNAQRDGSGNWQWLVGGTVDVLMRTINGLTPWKDTERRRVWRNTFRTLRENGVPTPVLQQAALDLWAASAAEITAPVVPTTPLT